ncbi:hypothetical protein [Hyphomicrobium sp.]|uniref:hypothetical protein n=1 Tax=Hyphomicrobium sp. TaxID=82 RepID=UPI002D76864C|nr:hypothetical protein [Hyphomicrobium sp.]HET6390360.1 hypothetical protein [Hyphomicrobium sp.]
MVGQVPSSFDLIYAAGKRRGSEDRTDLSADDFEYHVYTYKTFLWWTVLFVAHVFVILAFMAYFLVPRS